MAVSFHLEEASYTLWANPLYAYFVLGIAPLSMTPDCQYLYFHLLDAQQLTHHNLALGSLRFQILIMSGATKLQSLPQD